MISCKRYDLEGFAEYAQTLLQIQQCRDTEEPNLVYITKTYRALVSSGTGDAEKEKALVEEVAKVWKKCGNLLKDAKEFITSQTPLKAQGLQENIEVSQIPTALYDTASMNVLCL